MKKIINGFRYDTEKAIEIGGYSSPHSANDFSSWSATLYKTRRAGRFFLHGEGGPMSRYGQPVSGGMGAGEKLEPMDQDTAFAWASEYLDQNVIEEHFGDMIEDA